MTNGTYASDKSLTTMPRFFAGVDGLLTRPLSCEDIIVIENNVLGSGARRSIFRNKSAREKSTKTGVKQQEPTPSGSSYCYFCSADEIETPNMT